MDCFPMSIGSIGRRWWPHTSVLGEIAQGGFEVPLFICDRSRRTIRLILAARDSEVVPALPLNSGLVQSTGTPDELERIHKTLVFSGKSAAIL